MSLQSVAWRIGPHVGPALVWFDDDFLSGDVVSPRPATPGPGHLRIGASWPVDEVAGGSLVLNGPTPSITFTFVANSDGSPMTFARLAGRAFLIQASDFDPVGAVNRLYIGWSDEPQAYRLRAGLYIQQVGTDHDDRPDMMIPPNPNATSTAAIQERGSVRQFAFLMLENGYLGIARSDAHVPRLFWYYDIDGADTKYATAWTDPFTMNFKLDRWAVVDTALSAADWRYLAAPTVTDGDFTHPADMMLRFTVTAMPSGDDLSVIVRQVDATNYWRVALSPTGDLSLIEYTTALPSGVLRAAATGFSANQQLTIHALDDSIYVYRDFSLALQYAAATLGQTATGGSVTLNGASASTLTIWRGRATSAMQAKWEALWA